MIVIDRSATWLHELAWLVTERAKLGHERAIFGREYLHPLVESIGDEQEISMMVERKSEWHVELAILVRLAGAKRELDSTVSVT